MSKKLPGIVFVDDEEEKPKPKKKQTLYFEFGAKLTDGQKEK